jgi:GT2 family glycosyltransferase
VPVFADWDRVPALLAALSAQDLQDFEIVLVDNAPEPDAAATFVAGLVPGVQVVHCPRPGSYAARNAGAGRARGQWLAFTDADCLPQPGWLAALVEALSRAGRSIVAGPVRVQPGPAPSRWEIFDTVRGIPQDVFVRHGYAATANLALSRQLFTELNGFDPLRLSGGDAEFCRRARSLSVSLHFAAYAVVDHPARANRDQLVTKARRIKGGQVAVGPLRRRVFWTFRSVVPPVREMGAYLTSDHPWRWRMTACAVRLSLWQTELMELGRLLVLHRPPERR